MELPVAGAKEHNMRQVEPTDFKLVPVEQIKAGKYYLFFYLRQEYFLDESGKGKVPWHKNRKSRAVPTKDVMHKAVIREITTWWDDGELMSDYYMGLYQQDYKDPNFEFTYYYEIEKGREEYGITWGLRLLV